MSYIVVYQRPDGSSAVEECSDLDLAVVTAERLRNVDSIERPRIFKTEEVTYDFRPYYRVEVTGDGAASEDDGWQSGVQEEAPSVEATEVFDQVEEPVADVDPIDVDQLPPPPPDEPETESVADDAMESDDADDDEPASVKRGLFNEAPEVPQEFPAVTQISEEEIEATPPPRRGLFGR